MTPEQKRRRLDRLMWRYHNEPAYRDRVLEQQKMYRETEKGRTAVRARKRRFRERHPATAETNGPRTRKYGLTPDDYNAMLARQGGGCFVCKRPESQRSTVGKLRRLAIDHDHQTGRVRALLCHRCNTAIGLIEEDPEWAVALSHYLGISRWYREREPKVVGESVLTTIKEGVAA